jgi:asparagine synthase (glutamine-hydrolysing)
MVKALTHRGPDAYGIVDRPGCHFGHTRLSIIDLATGAQPMADVSGRYLITFNGEIYNYRELRAELLVGGHRFSTHSDTEVIMAAYARWGASCLDRLRGMFAFAIWDARTRRLFAARDLFGEKPLYYAVARDGVLLFGSEIRAIIASGLAAPRLSLEAVDAFLAFGYVPPHRTIYENVQTLPPGHYLEWDGDAPHTRRYWYPRFEPRPIGLDDAAERLRHLLQQAVRRQMVADVPVGAFLSGGHDSSTIVALMQQETRQPVKTFSVGFGEHINELPYARAVAKLYGTEHHDVDLGAPPVAAMLERMAEVYDEPFRDASHIPTYLISKYARQYVKVVLTGDGADELFGGYAWYPLLAKSAEVKASWFKWLVLRSASKVLGDRISSLDFYSQALGIAVRHPAMWKRYVVSLMIKPETRRKWWGSRAVEVTEYLPGEYYKPPTGVAGMNEALLFDLLSFLPGDILVKVDRAAMANSLETRAPFLDRDVAEIALSLPSTLKVKDREKKILFRSACRRYWPSELESRGKQGFAGPFQVWLDLPDVQAILRRLFAGGSALRELLPGLQPEQCVHRNYATWNLLTLGLWLERHAVRA